MTTNTTAGLVGLAGSADAAGIADERLEAELCQLAAHLAAGIARWLGLVAEYDRRRVWEQWECRSMAHWLVGHLGIARVTARQYVHVAHKLGEYPLLRAEFEAGHLSYSRVRAVCRVITPSSEKDLVNLALHATAPQLERFAAGIERTMKRNAATSEDHIGAFEARELQFRVDDDGSVIVTGRLPSEIGTALRRALAAQIGREDDAAGSASDPAHPARDAAASLTTARTSAQRLVDALAAVIEAGHVALERAATDPTAEVTATPLVVVHRYPDGDELEHGPVVAPTLADELSCDADTIVATHHREEPGDTNEPAIRFGRRHRVPPVSLRRFLIDRDRRCRAPGCEQRRHLHAHHIQHWSAGGPTKSANLVMLCPTHHRAVHRGGWTITGDPNGALTFLPPTRTAAPRRFDGDIEALIDHLSGPVRVHRYGDRFDLGLAVSTHLHNEALATTRT